jgi:hypothetical protein
MAASPPHAEPIPQVWRRVPAIEQKMDELAREYRDTHDREIIEELYRLDRERTDRFFSCVFFGIVLAKN